MTGIASVISEEIYELLYNGRQLTNSQIAHELGRTPNETRGVINHMLRTGELQATPTYKATMYRLIRPTPTGKKGKSV